MSVGAAVVRTGMLLFCLGVASVSRLGSLPSLSSPSLVLLMLATGGLLVTVLLKRDATARQTLFPCEFPSSVLSRPVLLWRACCTQMVRLVVPALCFLLGLFWALLVATGQMTRLLPAELEGQDFWVEGRVVSLPGVAGRVQRFDFFVLDNCFRLLPDNCVDQPAVLTGSRIRLSYYGDEGIVPGQHWLFRVRLNRPHGLSNPGVADYEALLFQQGIVARGYVRDTSFNTLLNSSQNSSQIGALHDFRSRFDIQAQRFALAQGIKHLTAGAQREFRHTELLLALVLGDRTGISAEQWELFTATGTNHLMVISGLHVGFVAMTAYWLINLGSRTSVWFLLRCPAQRAGAVAAIIAALIYAMMAGFSLPTQRALAMVAVLMCGPLLGRRILPSYSLLLAATLILLRDPLSVTQAGFWLSFSAVASLLLAFNGYRHAPRSRGQRIWANWGQSQWVVSAGLLIPLIVWTGQISLISPLVNVLAIPVVSLLVVPLALSGSLFLWVWPALALWMLWIADLALFWLMSGLGWVVSVTPALWQAPQLSALALFCALAGSLLFLVPRGIVPIRLAPVLLLPLLWPPLPQRPEHGQAQIQFLDVGQGLAIVVHTRNHHLLFDTGPGAEDQFDAGQSVILPYLRHRSVNALDMVIVSHWHQDHSGGLDTVLQALPVGRKLAGTLPSDGHLARRVHRSGFDACARDEQWQWDGVTFHILHPGGERYRGENDNSCVLMIRAGSHAALLTGDIELAAERVLVQHYGEALAADVLQAPHHGSHTSSSPPFVRVVQPQVVVVSAGYRNRFGHPSAQVMERFDEAGTQVYETFRDGAIQFELGGSYQPRLSGRHRPDQRRYWHNQP